MQLPLIATNWSGTTEFANELNSFPVHVESLVPVRNGAFSGHLWAQPSILHLSEMMRYVVANPVGAAVKAKRAREDMVKLYSPTALAATVLGHLDRIGARLSSPESISREL